MFKIRPRPAAQRPIKTPRSSSRFSQPISNPSGHSSHCLEPSTITTHPDQHPLVSPLMYKRMTEKGIRAAPSLHSTFSPHLSSCILVYLSRAHAYIQPRNPSIDHAHPGSRYPQTSPRYTMHSSMTASDSHSCLTIALPTRGSPVS